MLFRSPHCAKFRQHSILLNHVLWTMLKRMGRVGPNDTEAHGDPEEVTAAFFAQDDLFAYMTNLRIAVTPEYEGDWTARMYEDQEEPTHVARGDSPRAAIEAVITLSHEPGLEECPCCDDTGCSNCEPGPSTPSHRRYRIASTPPPFGMR